MIIINEWYPQRFIVGSLSCQLTYAFLFCNKKLSKDLLITYHLLIKSCVIYEACRQVFLLLLQNFQFKNHFMTDFIGINKILHKGNRTFFKDKFGSINSCIIFGDFNFTIIWATDFTICLILSWLFNAGFIT